MSKSELNSTAPKSAVKPKSAATSKSKNSVEKKKTAVKKPRKPRADEAEAEAMPQFKPIPQRIRQPDYFEENAKDPEFAIPLAEALLTPEELADVDVSRIKIQSKELYDAGFSQFRADAIFEIPYKKSEEYVSLFIIVEHKSRITRETIAQVYAYYNLVLLNAYRNHKRSDGTFYFPVIIPVVYYTGPSRKLSLNIGSMFKRPEDNKAQLNFEVRLRNLSEIVDISTPVDANHLKFDVVERMFRVIYSENIQEALGSLESPMLKLAKDKSNAEFLRFSMAFLLKNSDNIEEQEYVEFIDKINPKGDYNMKSLADRLYEQGVEEGRKEGLEEGMEKGMEKGEARGVIQSLTQMLAYRFGKLSQKALKTLKQIFDPELLNKLFERALSCESLKEFEGELLKYAT